MDGTLSLSDLKDALKETLEARGSMGQIKARIRAEIFNALDEGAPKAKISNENLIVNELIREYMEYNGYRHTLSVFLPESGQPVEKPFQRRFLAQELNITDDPRYTQVPLLYSIVAALQDTRNHPSYATPVEKTQTERAPSNADAMHARPSSAQSHQSHPSPTPSHAQSASSSPLYNEPSGNNSAVVISK
ncbi:hypothetical protein LEN26_011552 [Aphanomyces euteiches]|nr:hypothetical protein AeMF1_010260 [Aphanomyces euteiches]KAH9119594.1 hypothetical protein LEN26_011552 [Aphanomyces euteiches]KAH9191238.1 hypothetical protein AeNC1_006787 [Aphanomyces euteiches]